GRRLGADRGNPVTDCAALPVGEALRTRLIVYNRLMRLSSKIAWAVAALVGVLALLVVLLPRLIDVEAYRPAITEAVRDAPGRELVSDGPVPLARFRVPGIAA